MRRLLIFLFLLIASIWVGVTLTQHPGYLLIVFQPWTVQMPVWFALISAVVLLVLFYLLINGMDRIQFLWYRFKNWLRARREHQSYSKTQQGLTALIEGQWQRSEQLLLAGVNQSVEPLVNYLGAAKAAHKQAAFERRDSYIQKAYEIAPNEDIAIGITQTELEIDQYQLEHAAATLNHLREKSPRHARVLKLLEKIYVRLGDWQSLLALLPALRKSRALTSEQQEIFEKNVYCEILNSTHISDLTTLQKLWHDMPRHIRNNPDVVYAYVKQLMRFNDTDKESEELIRRSLKYYWQPQLVLLYSKLHFPNLNRQLVIAGAWLKTYGPKPEILLLLGKLCVRVQLWGKAKDYFEKCLEQGPNPEASLEYGKLLEQLDETAEALQKYKEGLTTCTFYLRQQVAKPE